MSDEQAKLPALFIEPDKHLKAVTDKALQSAVEAGVPLDSVRATFAVQALSILMGPLEPSEKLNELRALELSGKFLGLDLGSLCKEANAIRAEMMSNRDKPAAVDEPNPMAKRMKLALEAIPGGKE